MNSRKHWTGSGNRKAAGAGLGVLVVVAATIVAGTVPVDDVSAAPNPYMGEDATHTITIDSDGSYQVHIDQTMELARNYKFTFGGMVHDGFRLPDTESVLPPYLRAQYSDPTITMDGQAAEVDVEHEVHAVDISAEDTFTKGEHEGTVDYRVTGAAVGSVQAKTGGVAVYFRSLVPGDVVVKSAESIVAVECEDWPPEGEPCGRKSGDDWLIGPDELAETDAVRIILDTDEAGLSEPRIDSTK
ncbi:hypothetical protein [Brevibacterium aurantiacum]|uniref:Uncharacterized protein n=1 Tax=Brevibacterium aurantiacum TaxID=273384 RepID=A0A1D7W615_BREAU|nr:hypothetical protein [Brevibacterium aurantiacum]AOP54410.1 hypothetical protein BLSMQ_2704 [Brevibacterium aurantiacum]AZL10013.1 hypothetical protein CXR26_12865 [Brevibacterium aurantiacum]PCC48742.1 hypothetical protein CIK62_16935 [Brevibacterium aurantiacum]RCS99995.1 hypothetical protein CIK60_03015 [Brevibacterium aurantiacum]